MKHKHADLIHAWADGAEIQLFQTSTGKWVDLPNPPEWGGSTYRIKPEEKKPVVRWLWAINGGVAPWVATSSFYSDEEMNISFGKTYAVKLDWTRTEFPE